MPHTHPEAKMIRTISIILCLLAAPLRPAGAQLNNVDRAALQMRKQLELQGKAAAEAAGPTDAQKAAVIVKQLDDPDENVRAGAVTQLRVLARRVDRFGGARQQRGDEFEPKVPGLVPLLVKTAHDESESVRRSAAYALADTLDPEAISSLRELLSDKSEAVRVTAACLLTEFHDASGLGTLKLAVKHFQVLEQHPDRYFEAELVLHSLERITGKSFGPIPMNPSLHSNSETGKAAEKRYQELFQTWNAWWDWQPEAK
jgi:hypothetical protein